MTAIPANHWYFAPIGSLTIVLVPVFVATIAALYRLELRRVTPATAALLLALRTVTVIGLFLVWTTNPVRQRTVLQPHAQRVIVAVDLSDSMRVGDSQRMPMNKLRLARALGLHRTIVAEDRIAEWIEQWKSGKEPRLASADEGAAYAEVLRRCDLLTRLQCVELALASDGGGFLDKLAGKHSIELIGIGRDVSELPTDGAALRAAIATPSASTAFTDLQQALTHRADATAVVLFTDGRHNCGDSPFASARTLGSQGTAIFPVNVAPAAGESDVSILSLKPATTTVCRGSTLPVTMQVLVRRWAPGRIDVQLKWPGATPLSESIRHTGNDRTYEVVFHPRFERTGMVPLSAEVRPDRLDPRPENNSQTARVSVVEDRPRVLLIDGEARWEFQFLRNALARSKEPELDLKTVLFRQPRIGETKDADAESAGLPALKLPDGEQSLADFDCIVLGDVSRDEFSPKDRERLEKFVADSGGTLILSAGKRHLPMGLEENDPINRLLPIRKPREFAPSEGFSPRFTEDGRRAWFLRLGDTDDENRKIGQEFPPHYWAAIGSAKDGAEVLMTAKGPVDVLVARQQYGFGRVLYLGLDSTWRWRFKAGDVHHNRFWRQVVHWAVADRLLPVKNSAGTIRFGPRQPFTEVGHPVEILLRTRDAVPLLSSKAIAAVKIVRLTDGSKEEVTGLGSLAPVEGRSRELRAELRGLPPGRYAVEPVVAEWSEHLRPADGSPKFRATFEVIPPDSNEMADLSPNLPLMEELASTTGGRVYDLAQIDELADALQSRAGEKEVEVSMPLQRSWWTFGIVAALLALEWLIRKVSGLA